MLSGLQNEQRQRRRDEAAAGTKWELKHFKHVDNCPTCTKHPVFGFLLLTCTLDERLGKLFGSIPPTEDTYVYLNNGPHN